MGGKRWLRATLAALVIAGAAGGGVLACRGLLPQGDAVAEGVVLGGARADGDTAPRRMVTAYLESRLATRVTLRHEGRVVLESSLQELGAEIDRVALESALAAVGRRGDLWRRLDDSYRARSGHIAIRAPIRVPVEPLARRLAGLKQDLDREAEPARWDFDRGAATEHRDGVLLDVHAVAEAVAASASAGPEPIAVDLDPDALAREAPRATREVLATADLSHVVSKYQTRFGFVGSERGRAQNIARAARALHGLVLMPGEVISFNELVGPRSQDNGFAKAGEIYKGEMRMGIGGGTCQVASTLHAAAYLGGMEVVQRSPHSRPSGYIGVGLDATVAYPHVDLKLKNPFEFPVVVRAEAHEGVLTMKLLGADRPAKVQFAAATVGVRPYERKVREAAWLADGRVIKKQKGIRGLTIEKTRRIEYRDGRFRSETTTDVYPPTTEVYYVAPGTNVDEALPPLPEDA